MKEMVKRGMSEVARASCGQGAMTPLCADVRNSRMSRLISAIANNRYETGEVDADGNPITTTLAEEAIVARMLYMKEHPESWKLDELTRACEPKGQQQDAGKEQSMEDFFYGIKEAEETDGPGNEG